MNSILKRRIKLIRAMIEAKRSFSSFGAKAAISNIINSIREDKVLFLSVSADDPTKVSYQKKAVDILNEDTRIKTSLQRFIRRQMEVTNDVISDANLDKLANLTSLFLDEALDSKIKVLSGIDIANFYANTPIKSCMTGGCHSYKTSIYELNKNKVKLAIFNEEVRALLWLCDDGSIVLDRAYPSGHWGVNFIRTWAHKKGYLLRNNADTVSDNNTNGISDDRHHTVTLIHEGIYPYMDTFKFGIMGKNKVLLSNNPEFGSAIFTNTDGLFYMKEVCGQCGIPTNDRGLYTEGRTGEQKVFCKQCYAKECFKCSLCHRVTENKNKYQKTSLCDGCFTLSNGFIKFNKCGCANCIEKRRRYVSILNKEVVAQSKIKEEQMVFDFAQ